MRNSSLAAAWSAWRQRATYSGSAKSILLTAIARLHNRTLSTAWQSWRGYTLHCIDLKQRLRPLLEATLRGRAWAALHAWAGWAGVRVGLRGLLKGAQQTRQRRCLERCFAAWLHLIHRRTGASLSVLLARLRTCL